MVYLGPETPLLNAIDESLQKLVNMKMMKCLPDQEEVKEEQMVQVMNIPLNPNFMLRNSTISGNKLWRVLTRTRKNLSFLS
jgi:hypothetical protein